MKYCYIQIEAFGLNKVKVLSKIEGDFVSLQYQALTAWDFGRFLIWKCYEQVYPPSTTVHSSYVARLSNPEDLEYTAVRAEQPLRRCRAKENIWLLNKLT